VRPADELVRVVRIPGAGLAVGRTLPGRGAWLCADSPECAAVAGKRRAFGRALRGQVKPAAIAALRTELAERARMVGHRDDGT